MVFEPNSKLYNSIVCAAELKYLLNYLNLGVIKILTKFTVLQIIV